LKRGEPPADEPRLKTNRWKKNKSMSDLFRDKNHDHPLHGEEGKINYRDFGHWANLADAADSAEEFERSVGTIAMPKP